jgi:hypothetical protein
LFDQSFSWDHVDFFFSTETKKKLTSEISVLKIDLDLCRAEMEIERQTHQKEEKNSPCSGDRGGGAEECYGPESLRKGEGHKERV